MKKQFALFIISFFCFGCTQDSPLPDKGAPFTDSLYGTTVVRMTDKKIDGYEGSGIQNEYAKADAWNSDESHLILRDNDAHWYLYNAETFALEKDLSPIVGSQELEPRWHASDPALFYYLYDSSLMEYNIATDAKRVVHDFKNDFPACAIITTGTEGDASQDRRYWCFMVADSSFALQAACVYDMTADAVVGTKTNFPDAVNFTTMDASGSHALIGYDSLPFQAFYSDFTHPVDFVQGAAGHGDVALLKDGSDVMVYQNVANDYICMTDLETGIETKLLEIPFNVSTDIGLHISGNCYSAPGWVLISTYGAKKPPRGQEHSWMDNLLFMLELKVSPAIVKLAQTHSYTALHPEAVQKNYFAESFASINREGTKVVFGSNWGILLPDYTDAYQVLLPELWKEKDQN